MSSSLFGAGTSTLPFYLQNVSPSSAGFIPIERLSPAPSSSSLCFINLSSNRLRPRCKDRSRDSIGFETGARDARITDEEEHEDWVSSPSASPYQILGINPASCSPSRLKAAFRARMLSKHFQFESVERSSSDPFEEPESEACEIFVNELLCVGKGCSYSCVKRAPHAFSFTSENGTARVISQDHVDDYQVQLAVGQCPRRCIHYVTPFQRAILQGVLQRVLDNPFDMGEAAFLESLISKAIFENRRYEKPKRKPKIETQYVDWS